MEKILKLENACKPDNFIRQEKFHLNRIKHRNSNSVKKLSSDQYVLSDNLRPA